MALSSSRLARNMDEKMKSNIKSSFPDANPGDNMSQMTKGIAEGVVNTLRGKSALVIPAGVISAGSSTGIIGLSAAALEKQIITQCKIAFGAEGVALKDIASAIASSVVDELQQASLNSPSAGPVSNITGWGPSQMGSAIAKSVGFPKTEHNTKMFMAIGTAITMEIQLKGMGAIFPSGSLGGGSPMVTLS